MGSQPARTSIDKSNRKRDNHDTNPFSAEREDLDLNERANQLASENGEQQQQQQQKKKFQQQQQQQQQQQRQQQQQQQPSPKKMKFTVTYSHLCDGGMQEMSTAVAGVREVFPDASIQTHRRTSLEDQESFRNGESVPSVVVSLHQHQHQHQHQQNHRCEDNGTCNSNKKPGVRVLWSANQRHLYLKHPKKRQKSVKHLRKTLLAVWNNNNNNNNNNMSSSSFSSSSSSLSWSFATATATPPEDDGDPDASDTSSSSTCPNVVPGTCPNVALVTLWRAGTKPKRERKHFDTEEEPLPS